MNSVRGTIADIQLSGRFLLVTVNANKDITLKAIAIAAPDTESMMAKDQDITLLFKESEVVIGLNEPHAISLQNRIPGTIGWIEEGSLISKLGIDTSVGELISIISTNSVQRLELSKGKEIVAMVKLNEMMISD